MIKNYAIFIFLCTFHIITCTNKTDVFYDPKYDIIFHNGKLYFPSKYTDAHHADVNNETNNNGLSNANTGQNTNVTHITHHKDKLVSGAAFWFYLVSILCIVFLICLIFLLLL